MGVTTGAAAFRVASHAGATAADVTSIPLPTFCFVASHAGPTAACFLGVGPSETSGPVDDNDDVVAALDHALRSFDDHLGDGDLLLGRPVERRGDDLAEAYQARR